MSFAKPPIVYRLYVYALLTVLGAFAENYGVNIILSTSLFLFLLYESEWPSGVHMMFMAAFATFIYLPAIVAGYFSAADFSLYYLTSICAFVFIFNTKGITSNFAHNKERAFIKSFYFFAALIISLSISEYYYVFSLWGPFVMFFSLNLQVKSFRRNTYLLILFIIVFAIYSGYGWNGYGRAVTLGFLMSGVLYYLYAQDYKVPKIIWAILPGFASTLLSNRSLIDLEFSGFENALNDSAFGPYVLASTFLDYYNDFGSDISGFIDNVIFTAISFIPREWWPSKPYGFGFEFVVRHMDYYLVEAGFSIASTMVGDHLYYLGYFGLATSIVMTILVARLCRYLYSLKMFYGFAAVIMSCYMLVFVWGGMTSLSARLIFPFAAFLGYISFVKLNHFIFQKKKI